MDLSNILSISGMPGLFKMVSNRPNGLLVEDLTTGKTKFASARKYQFTPLESIAIYTDDDTVELKEVFRTMKSSTEEMPSSKDSANVLSSYFSNILPDYDRDRVFPKDMKKIISWFNYLSEKNLLEESEEELKEEKSAATEEK